eukprot:110137_1
MLPWWSCIQWSGLLIVSLMTLAYMYNYSCPVPVQDQLMNEYNLSQLQYNLLFSVMAWPTIVFCLFGGILTDKIGVKTMMICTYCLATIGHFLFIIGCIKSIPHNFNFILMAIGRSIYGTFAEIWTVTRKSFLCELFDKNDISFAMGINTAFGAIGSMGTFSVIYQMYKLNGIIFAFVSGLVFLIISIILITALITYMKIQNNAYEKITDDELLSSMGPAQVISNTNDDKTNNSFSSTSPLRTKNEGTMRKMILFCKHAWFDIKQWDIRYWLLSLILVLFSGITFGWMNISASFIHNTYNYSYTSANNLILLVWIMMTITGPIFGYVVDRYGKRCQSLTLCGVLLIIIHFIYANAMNKYIHVQKQIEYVFVIISLILMGIVWGLYTACTWPVIMLVVDKSTIATAYGMVTSIQNCTLALFPLIIAYFTKEHNENNDQYLNVEYFMISTSVVTTIVCAILWHIDNSKFKNSLGIAYN